MPMQTPHAAAVACALLLLATTPTIAQTPTRLKPGLWEHSFQAGSQGGQIAAAMKDAQKAMANMPPEQRKMVEKMMAEQGVSLGADGQKIQLCLTPDDVARDEFPAARDGCTQKAERSGDTWTMTVQCPARDGQPASSGRGTVTLQGSTGYAGDFTMDRRVDGKPEQMTMKTRGRWISADCGSVKPIRR
jgi:hypothetical protein